MKNQEIAPEPILVSLGWYGAGKIFYEIADYLEKFSKNEALNL